LKAQANKQDVFRRMELNAAQQGHDAHFMIADLAHRQGILPERGDSRNPLDMQDT